MGVECVDLSLHARGGLRCQRGASRRGGVAPARAPTRVTRALRALLLMAETS